MSIRYIALAAILFSQQFCFSQNASNSDSVNFNFENFLEKIDSPILQQVISNPEYRCQIIYTQINRDSANTPTFNTYTYHLDTLKYFNPASLVKLPTALLALEKINNLHIEGLDKNNRMITDSSSACQHSFKIDTSSATGYASIAHYIKRMLLVSENDPYSRLYEFLGQEYIYNRLQSMGYTQTRIIHRFDPGCNTEQNKNTNRIEFVSQLNGKIIYTQTATQNKFTPAPPLGKIYVGRGYLDMHNKFINTPKDFTYSNIINLWDITHILRSILFPETTMATKRFNVTQNDREFIIRHMALLPREVKYPRYNEKAYPDNYKKYLLYGLNKSIKSDSVRIINIVGQSYGFMSDVAYIFNENKNVEFILSAVVYVNKDGIINDGRYEYESIALPFFSTLGKAVYEFELKRNKNTTPKLHNFTNIINFKE